MDERNDIYARFPIKPWHPLTEIPAREEITSAENRPVASTSAASDTSDRQAAVHPDLQGVSATLIKLLWDILVYMYASVSTRVKRLGRSGRQFERDKFEGLEKGFILESAAGQTTYLIPTPKTFAAFNMKCPYANEDQIEHSYYVGWGQFMLRKNSRYNSVQTHVKRGSSGAVSDIVTLGHDGSRQAWELTLSTTNILANACKYENTDFVRIIFLCRDYKLKEAVKACCREGGLNPDLLAKLEYMHFSHLLQQQRRLSLY